MDTAKYILRFNVPNIEFTKPPKEEDSIPDKVGRTLFWIFFCIEVFFIQMVGLRFITDVPVLTGMVIYLFLGCIFPRLTYAKDVPTPVEIQFYDDRLVVFKPRWEFFKRDVWQLTNVFMYHTITEVVYEENKQRLLIYGDGKTVQSKYDRNGFLPEKPTKEWSFEGGAIRLDMSLADKDGINFVKEIQDNAPVDVHIVSK